MNDLILLFTNEKRKVTILTTSSKPFDFRTMLYLNLLLMCVLIFSGRQEVLILSFVLSILVFATIGSMAQTVKVILGFLALLVLQYGAELLRGTDLPRGLIFVPQLIVFIALRIYPFVVLGIAIKRSTNIAEITTALTRLRLHRGIILSIVVMIRYLPAMKDDFRVIVDAMRLKGIPVSLGYVMRHPMKAIEYFVVPMLFRSEKITEEFSGAALVKGYEYSGTRTSYFDVRMGGKDWAMIFLAPLAFVLCLIVV